MKSFCLGVVKGEWVKAEKTRGNAPIKKSMHGKGKGRSVSNGGTKYKGKKPMPAAKGLNTFEEIMEEGVKQEEKGERYATGEKAQRFYERARELYAKAHEKKPTDADCLYNWGRILYILVNFVPAHASFEPKLSLLDESIEKFRAALVYEPDNGDALFNLAQALTSKADIIQERDTDGFDDAKAALHEAVQSFERVYLLQQEELQVTQQIKNSTTGKQIEGGSDIGKASSSSSSISPSDLAALKIKDSQASTTGETVVTEITPVTTETLIDTLISIAHTLSCLASLIESIEAAEKYYIQANQKLEEALSLNVPSKESEIQHQWANVYSAQAERVYQETGSVLQVQRLYEIAVRKMDSAIERDVNNVEVICDQGDLLTEYAMKLVIDNELEKEKESEKEPEKQDKIRGLFDQAVNSFVTALKLEPKNASILEKLASLNFTMSLLPFIAMEKGQPILHSDALRYYKRALDADPDNLDTYLCYALVACHVPGKDGDVVKVLQAFKKNGGTRGFLEEWQLEKQELLRSSAVGKEFVGRVVETCFPLHRKNVTDV